MEEKSKSFQITYYLDIILRRRWYIIIPFCVIVILGMMAAIKLPKVYTASTLIIVQAQSVPTEYVRPLVATDLNKRIAFISQQIKSRSNLEKVINKFNLFSAPEQTNMTMSNKVEILNRNISVEVIRDRMPGSQAEAFSIHFKGKNPEMVMKITNDLAESFINENLRLREGEIVGTSNFIEDQLALNRIKLQELEQKIKSFRMENMGGLPEQLDSNLRVLDRLQMQYNQKQENLREAKQRQILIINQISELEALQQSNSGYASPGGPVAQNDPYVRLQNMKEELEQLKSRYTDSHPDVLRMKQSIRVLEQQIEAGVVTSSDERTDEVASPVMNPFWLERQNNLALQQNEIKLEIAKLEAESIKLIGQIADYQNLVEETPKREQELVSLKRDYENIQNSYSLLLDKRMQAEMAVNLEINKRGEQFRIIDQAQLPVKPSEPDMRKIFMLTMLAALGFGGGIVFLLEYFDHSIKQKKDIESEVGIPVLVSIPMIMTPNDLVRSRINNIATLFSIAFAMMLCSGFGLMVLKGVDPTVEMFKRVIG
jgi:polysaccharide chain length determinant protein (PEP-CTERM system associated)